jgi:hypothetical protein
MKENAIIRYEPAGAACWRVIYADQPVGEIYAEGDEAVYVFQPLGNIAFWPAYVLLRISSHLDGLNATS